MQPLVERVPRVQGRRRADHRDRGAAQGSRHARARAGGDDRRSRRAATRCSPSSRSCSSRRIPTTPRTSSWKSAPAPAATRRRCSPRICSGCTPATPSARAGRSRCCRSATAASAASRKSSRIIEGKNVYSRLKYESGVHRVQRVPATEAQRPHPHLDGDRRGAAGSRGSRHPDRRQGPAHRHVLLERPRRPERQHHLLGGAHHAPADRARRVAAGREVADQEPREGDEGAALAALRDGDAEAAGRDRQGSPLAGRHRRALGEDPHLQLQGEPHHRSPHRLHDAPARRGARRRSRRADRRGRHPLHVRESSRTRPKADTAA